MRREWPRINAASLRQSTLLIAKLWLQKARKRRTFTKLVKPIIDKNIRMECELCNRTPSIHGVKLSCQLANTVTGTEWLSLASLF